MTCKEAEQMVMPYINDELTDKELSSFQAIRFFALEHIFQLKVCLFKIGVIHHILYSVKLYFLRR